MQSWHSLRGTTACYLGPFVNGEIQKTAKALGFYRLPLQLTLSLEGNLAKIMTRFPPLNQSLHHHLKECRNRSLSTGYFLGHPNDHAATGGRTGQH